MAEQVLSPGFETLDTANATLTQLSPRLPNLPLPRELRDHIWGYLLYHKNVHEEPYHKRSASARSKVSEENARSTSSAHTFHFHTAILAVNHQISKEASKVLRSNDFVIISHKAPLYTYHKHYFSLPIVSETPKSLICMKIHNLRVHVQGSKQSLDQSGTSPTTKQHSFCIISSDLPQFCNVMQNLLLRLRSSAKIIPVTEDFNPATYTVEDFPVQKGTEMYTRTSIQFQGELSVEHQSMLLKPFRRMIHGNQKVNVSRHGNELDPEISSLKKVMGPRTLWINAMAWYTLEFIQVELAETHKLVQEGDHEFAAKRYTMLTDFAEQPWFVDMVHSLCETKAGVPVLMSCLALLDAGANAGFPWMRLGYARADASYEIFDQFKVLKFRLQDIIALERRFSLGVVSTATGEPETSDMPLPLCRAFWCGAMMAFRHYDVSGWRDVMHLLKPFLMGDDHFDHDLSLVDAFARDESLSSEYTTSNRLNVKYFGNTSAGALPVRVYHGLSQYTHMKPDGLEGFTDIAHRSKIRALYPEIYDIIEA